MSNYTYKIWHNNDIYNFNEEFNRIESKNEYCKKWLAYFGISTSITNKFDWNNNDIVDLNDYNRVKRNINIILSNTGNPKRLSINSQENQTFNSTKANEIEDVLKDNISNIGSVQFKNNVCGISTCGNNIKLGGV